MQKGFNDKKLGMIPPVQPKVIGTVQKFTLDDIDVLNDRHDENVVFSYELIDTKNKDYNLGCVCDNWFETLFDVMKEISIIKWREVELDKKYNVHPIDFEYLKKTLGFRVNLSQQFEPVQFSLGKTKGRVHGFHYGNRFYIIWLDPNHHLYQSDLHDNTKFSPLKSCFEIINDENQRLTAENFDLLQKIEDTEKACDLLLDDSKDKYSELQKKCDGIEKQLAEILNDENRIRTKKYNEKIKKRKSKK